MAGKRTKRDYGLRRSCKTGYEVYLGMVVYAGYQDSVQDRTDCIRTEGVYVKRYGIGL